MLERLAQRALQGREAPASPLGPPRAVKTKSGCQILAEDRVAEAITEKGPARNPMKTEETETGSGKYGQRNDGEPSGDPGGQAKRPVAPRTANGHGVKEQATNAVTDRDDTSPFFRRCRTLLRKKVGAVLRRGVKNRWRVPKLALPVAKRQEQDALMN